jgi:hypothetical protein
MPERVATSCSIRSWRRKSSAPIARACSLHGPGKLESVTLNPYRRERCMQELAFQLARDLTPSVTMASAMICPATQLVSPICRGRDARVRILANLAADLSLTTLPALAG